MNYTLGSAQQRAMNGGVRFANKAYFYEQAGIGTLGALDFLAKHHGYYRVTDKDAFQKMLGALGLGTKKE